MLNFKILNGYKAKDKGGHAHMTFDTTVEQDVRAAEMEFERLLKEGRTAVTEEGNAVTKLPSRGTLYFLLPMAGGQK